MFVPPLMIFKKLNSHMLLLFSRSLFCLLPALHTKWEHRRTFPQSNTTSKQLQKPDSCVKDMEPRQVEGSLHVALMAAKLFSTIISTIIVNVILESLFVSVGFFLMMKFSGGFSPFLSGSVPTTTYPASPPLL